LRPPSPTTSIFFNTIGTTSKFEDIDHEIEQSLDQELDINQLFTVSGALTYLFHHVMTSGKDALLVFCDIHGINDIDDFMCITQIDFKQTYSVTSNSDIPITLSTTLVKKLISDQSWYGHAQQEYPGDPNHLIYSLTTESLTLLRCIQTLKRFDLSTPAMPTPTAPTPPVVHSSAPASSSFWHNLKINISDYPKLKDETPWRAFDCQQHSTAASHNTIDNLTPIYVPPIHVMAYFQDKQRLMYNVFTNIIQKTKGKNCVREVSASLYAQKIYAPLLDVYHYHL
jgi:hypothetical protein